MQTLNMPDTIWDMQGALVMQDKILTLISTALQLAESAN